jgi:type II secretory pathway pseudopilin PulG
MAIRNKQAGYSLIEFMLVVGLMATAAMLGFSEKRLEMEQTQARATGNQLFQYQNAVRAWVSQNVGAADVLEPTPHLGTDWLKHTDCVGPAGSPIAYLPCDFEIATEADPIRFGELSMRTQIVSVTDPTTSRVITTATTELSPFTVGAKLRADLAGLAALTAAAGQVEGADSPYMVTTSGRVKSDPNNGVITLTSSNDASDDAWLRTDGSNTMNEDLRFNDTLPEDQRQIQNVSRLQALATETLFIGAAGGALNDDLVVVDANQQLRGGLVISNQLDKTNAIEVTQGDITALDGDIEGTVVRASQAAVAPIYRDSDDSLYFMDPSGTSILNSVTATGAVEAPLFLDYDDNNFYADFSGESWLNEVFVSRFMRVTNELVEGDACDMLDGRGTMSGLIAQDGNGNLVTCVSGRVRYIKGSPTQVASGWATSPVAACPANRQVTGGTCSVRGGTGTGTLDSAVSGNGWQCFTTEPGAQVQSTAFCQ